jgi:hypothetical protein
VTRLGGRDEFGGEAIVSGIKGKPEIIVRSIHDGEAATR